MNSVFTLISALCYSFCLPGVRNLVLGRHTSRAVKQDFPLYIQQYTSPNENFENGYLHSNALMQFCLKLEGWRKPHKAVHHSTKCDVINDVKLFPTVSQIFDVIQSDVTLQNQVH